MLVPKVRMLQFWASPPSINNLPAGSVHHVRVWIERNKKDMCLVGPINKILEEIPWNLDQILTFLKIPQIFWKCVLIKIIWKKSSEFLSENWPYRETLRKSPQNLNFPIFTEKSDSWMSVNHSRKGRVNKWRHGEFGFRTQIYPTKAKFGRQETKLSEIPTIFILLL